jgi:uncharacterized membrane protein
MKSACSVLPVKPPASILAAAREALAAYRTTCFWSLSPDFVVTAETLPIIIEGLRSHGDRRAFQLAAQLCH